MVDNGAVAETKARLSHIGVAGEANQDRGLVQHHRRDRCAGVNGNRRGWIAGIVNRDKVGIELHIEEIKGELKAETGVDTANKERERGGITRRCGVGAALPHLHARTSSSK